MTIEVRLLHKSALRANPGMGVNFATIAAVFASKTTSPLDKPKGISWTDFIRAPPLPSKGKGRVRGGDILDTKI